MNHRLEVTVLCGLQQKPLKLELLKSRHHMIGKERIGISNVALSKHSVRKLKICRGCQRVCGAGELLHTMLTLFGPHSKPAPNVTEMGPKKKGKQRKKQNKKDHPDLLSHQATLAPHSTLPFGTLTSSS